MSFSVFDWLAGWVAWHLPRRVVYHVLVRAFAWYTTRVAPGEVASEVTIVDVATSFQ